MVLQLEDVIWRAQLSHDAAENIVLAWFYSWRGLYLFERKCLVGLCGRPAMSPGNLRMEEAALRQARVTFFWLSQKERGREGGVEEMIGKEPCACFMMSSAWYDTLVPYAM